MDADNLSDTFSSTISLMKMIYLDSNLLNLLVSGGSLSVLILQLGLQVPVLLFKFFNQDPEQSLVIIHNSSCFVKKTKHFLINLLLVVGESCFDVQIFPREGLHLPSNKKNT
jgi:hypothetical protein